MTYHFATCARLLLVGLFAVCVSSTQINAASHPPLATPHGVVASDNVDASRVGASILDAGGNAIDAAIATALALGVVSPTSSGIGGGGFAVVYDAKNKVVRIFDFREVAPAKLSTKSFVRNGKLDPSLSRFGGLAVGVPGEIAGLSKLRKEFGRLPWQQLVQPAADLARKGFAASYHFARAAAIVVGFLGPEKLLSKWLSPKGKIIERGDFVRRTRLAKALESIGEKGPEVFYRGWVAEDIVNTTQLYGGVLTMEDLDSYKVIERKPLRGDWGKYEVVTMPIPSSGGLVLLAMLGILDAGGWNLPEMKREDSGTIHLLAEVLKHAFSDRARYLGGETSSELSKRFLSKSRLKKLAQKISKRKTQKSESYGDTTLPDVAPPKNDNGTSHLCVVDSEGNAVALTTTVNGYFGSGVLSHQSGIVLNNEIDDFALTAGGKNMFGLVQSKANLVGPGKRPLSSMTPTLVFENGNVIACAGASGGPRIISGTFQALLNALVWGLDAEAAVSVPRIHHQWLPDKLLAEKEVSTEVRNKLRRKGHKVETLDSITAVQMIIVDEKGRKQASSDPRKGGRPWAATR